MLTCSTPLRRPSTMPVATPRTHRTTWLGLLLLAINTLTLAQQVAPGVYVDQVSANLALEIKVGYQLGNNKLLYGGLYNNGTDNVIEFKMLNASATGVSIDQDLGDVDNGQIFGLGDWCISANYALMPYIKDFDVFALRYDLNNDSFDTVAIAPSQTDQYTSTDCMSFDLGTTTALVVAANNFDAKGIDYFRSDDDGDIWSLGIQYRLPGDNILDAFVGAFRDIYGRLPVVKRFFADLYFLSMMAPLLVDRAFSTLHCGDEEMVC